MERHLTCIGKALKLLAVNQVVAAGRWEVTVALNFISERSVEILITCVDKCYHDAGSFLKKVVHLAKRFLYKI
jgi:hypothetical protein